ncbi:MAG TPA: hypothetical protein VGH76_26855 [Actinomycetospora sp.]|uniref:hypothetical protein n=1 Tax=Actinomycetospora sp. TaxID=1872135 RepID=UPI002F427C59
MLRAVDPSPRPALDLAPRSARTLAVLGTGPQAREHVRYACLVHEFDEVLIGGRDEAKAAAIADDLVREGLPARGTTIPAALAAAEVVCAATSTVDPIVRPGDGPAGRHATTPGDRTTAR